MDNIRLGVEIALASLLLHLLPNLQHLDIRSHPIWRPHPFGHCLTHNFEIGLFGEVRGCSPTHVPGFTNLKSITSNVILPWSVAATPTVRTLEYKFEDYGRDTIMDMMPRGFRNPSQTPCSNISALILNLDSRFIEQGQLIFIFGNCYSKSSSSLRRSIYE
jgi:hypothetical protein